MEVTGTIRSGETGLLVRTSGRVVPTRQATAWRLVKRGVDVVLASVLLLLSAPVLLLAALLIKLDSPGPVVFRQDRLGLRCGRFRVLKLRTMTDGAASELHREYIAQLAATGNPDAALKKLTGDPRITRVGRLLRRTSVDELPQLLNVLRGQMSIVGPRPALDYELEHYREDDFDRFLVRPGLTGLWQVSGRNELGFREMLALDAEYARTSGPLLDLAIIVRTPLAVLRARSG